MVSRIGPPRAFAVVALAVAALVLAGCTGPTPYMPVGESGNGYSEQQLESGRYRVSFAGNSLTRRETVENYMLYRAAELTLSTGNDYFQVVSKDTDKSTTYRSTGPDVGVFGGRGGWGGGVGWGVGTTFSTAEPEQSFTMAVEVLLKQGTRPEGDANTYDARAVIGSLGPTIVRPEDAD